MGLPQIGAEELSRHFRLPEKEVAKRLGGHFALPSVQTVDKRYVTVTERG